MKKNYCLIGLGFWNTQARNYMPIVLLLFLMSCNTHENSTHQAEAQVDSGPTIALLGTFHFGETTDYSSMDLDNFNSKKRQNEIHELVQALVKFKPTKVLLECSLKDEVYFQTAYSNFLKNQAELTMDEREQIGFRLAAKLNHDKVYCIDYKMSVPLDSLSNFAEKHRKTEFLSFLESIEQGDEKDSKILAAKSIKEYYAYKNSDEQDLINKRQYIQETAKFVSDSTNIGIKFVATWWERNFNIMSNIDKHIGKEERILVLIGGAHRAVLKDFYQDRDDVNYEEIGNYLN